MTSFLKPILSILPGLAMATVLALPLTAQEATSEDETPPESVFNMGEEVDENGQPVAAEPQPGQQYLKEEFNDWALRCLRVAEGEDPCQMYQLLTDADGNAVAEIAIVRLADSGQAIAGATIVVPLETLLTEQLLMRVDGGTARRFPFNFCNQGGCVSRIGLTQEDINLFRRGNSATLRMVPAAAPDQQVDLEMSLSGFTAAFDAIE